MTISTPVKTQLPVLYFSRLRLFHDLLHNVLPPRSTPVLLVIRFSGIVSKVVEAASDDNAQPDFVHCFFDLLRRAKKEGRLVFIRPDHIEDFDLLAPILEREGLPPIDLSWLLKTSFMPQDICPTPTSIYQGQLEIRV